MVCRISSIWLQKLPYFQNMVMYSVPLMMYRLLIQGRKPFVKMRVYVDSWIEDKNGDKIGANVYFLLGKPIQDENNQMPAWKSCIGTLGWDFYNDKAKEFSLSFSSNDIEILFGGSNTSDVISYSIKGNTLCFHWIGEKYYDAMNHEVLIRHKNVYTEVYIKTAE